ncbi:MAG TPA: zinc-binding alcohol dehydrogenase family protein [Nocardioides sp.]|uniref:zinc-binding alcohol dehydrogenase family protein n=1 Tax=Nocardioides sp. TaxID=35761 RepID=UPI002E2EBC13|nr:zinc-binding alcohol dehydrogenase family protein [Nocardioides sp.]HEX3930126.1 zinc-binding alcohol dehydrogenase family protein [Nocardioides sp.]
MRGAVLHTPGRPPSYGEHPAPTSQAGRTLLRVTAAPLVPLDLLCASGTSYFGVPATPYVPGGQGVGVVESSHAFEPGTRVWFFATAGMRPGDGSLAELAAVPDGDVVPLAAGVSDELAAAVGLSGVAAWMALSWRAQLRPGERALVLGGGGAVGQIGIGAARVLGASAVVAVARTSSVERAAAAGADVVVPLVDDVDQLAAALAEHGPFDVVLDPVFGVVSEAASRTLAERGRLVNLGGARGDRATYSSSVIRSRTASILGYTNNALSPEQRREAIGAVLEHAAAGRVSMRYEVRSMADVEEVWARQAAGEPAARVVLVP